MEASGIVFRMLPVTILTSNIPVRLVRASQEPMQAQQALLLRAVTRTTCDEKALLLRVTAEEE